MLIRYPKRRRCGHWLAGLVNHGKLRLCHLGRAASAEARGALQADATPKVQTPNLKNPRPQRTVNLSPRRRWLETCTMQAKFWLRCGNIERVHSMLKVDDCNAVIASPPPPPTYMGQRQKRSTSVASRVHLCIAILL